MARVLREVDWTSAEGDPKPDVSFMPMMTRRRLSMVERAAMHVAWKVFHPDESEPLEGHLPEMGTVPVVFASRWGEIGTTLKLMRQFHSEGEMSPAAFSSSVHNAAPGAWSLFTGNRAPYTAVAAGARTYEMGLLEAESQLAAGGAEAVLFVYSEESTPEYYQSAFSGHVQAHAVAMLLVSDEG
jgi:hypothetical protein